jgi:hypothetical protein
MNEKFFFIITSIHNEFGIKTTKKCFRPFGFSGFEFCDPVFVELAEVKSGLLKYIKCATKLILTQKDIEILNLLLNTNYSKYSCGILSVLNNKIILRNKKKKKY